jgi:hypothetical protein
LSSVSEFHIECFQNEFLRLGDRVMNALLTVTVRGTGFATAPAGSSASPQKLVAEVSLRIWTPQDAQVTSLRCLDSNLDLTGTRVDAGSLVGEYRTGSWWEESRDYLLRVQVPPREVGEEVLAARVTMVIDGEARDETLVRATWSGDEPDDPDGGSRVRAPRRPNPTSGSGFNTLEYWTVEVWPQAFGSYSATVHEAGCQGCAFGRADYRGKYAWHGPYENIAEAMKAAPGSLALPCQRCVSE